MMPKAFLATDLGRELAEQQALLVSTRRRLDATEAAIALMRKRIDALRKRVDRQQACQQERTRQREAQEPLEH